MPGIPLAVTLIVTYLVKPLMEKWSPEHWQGVIVVTGMGLFATIYCFVYLLNLVSIRYGGKEELSAKLRQRWRDILVSPTAPQSASNVYLHRVANIQIKTAIPPLVHDLP